jgi:hypothetical protein
MPKFCTLFTAVFFIFLSTSVYAKDLEEKLFPVIQNYANCIEAVVGNFKDDESNTEVINLFFNASTKSVRTLINERVKSNDKNILNFIDMLGNKELVIGYMLAKMSEPSKMFKLNKQELQKKYNYDYKLVNKELWSSNGCSAIYIGLSK